MKQLYLSLLLSFCASAGMAEDIKVREMLRSQEMTIRKPILIDSVNVKKETFSNQFLLNSAVTAANGEFQVVEADTAGYFAVNGSKEAITFSLYRFYLRSDRYANVTLDVKTPGMVQIFADGKKIGDKTTTQDSLSSAGSATARVVLEPGQKEITIKYLSLPDSKENPVFCATVKPAKADSLAQIETTLDAQHPLTIENLMTGTRISRPSVSANGTYAILNFSTVLPDGKRVNEKKVVNLQNGRNIFDCNDKADLGWLPKRNLLYYTSMGMKGRELRTLDPASGQEELLATNLPKGYFNWSPDESYLIYSVQDEFPASKSELQQILAPDDRIAGWRNRNMLYRYSLDNGMMEQLTFGYHSTYLNDISADSKKILFSESETFLTERPFRRSSFYQLDLETFRVDTIWYQTGFINSIQYSPDQKELLVLASGESFNGIGLNVKPEQTANMYDVQAYLYDLEAKKVKPISKEFNPSIGNAQWNAKDGKIYFTCTDRDYVDVYSYDPRTAKYSKLPLSADVVNSFVVAENAPVAVYAGTSTSWPDKAFAYNLKNGRSTLLSDPQQEQAELYELGEVKEWNFVSTDGTTIEGRYYLPPNFDPTKKYPMIVYYYSGTTPSDRNFFHPYSMHLYAAQGYVVYTLQPSGTIGFGQEFAARHVNAWGIQTADDIITGVKKFCAEHSFVNAKKVGCMGASYGGFMTMYLQTRTDIFAAAVSHAGISALSSYWGEGYWGYSYSAAASANSYPWNNPKLYTEQSPLFHADKVNTPILLLHGKVDTNVPMGESIQMFNALKLLGKQVDFIQVEGENHGIAEFNRRIAWKKSIFGFFAKWLKDDPQWWEAQYPVLNLE
ncbi:MAG: prolyl oligopeptidase family serine peptidase [Bacteroidales bacterium]